MELLFNKKLNRICKFIPSLRSFRVKTKNMCWVDVHKGSIYFPTTQFVADALRIFAFNSNLTIIMS